MKFQKKFLFFFLALLVFGCVSIREADRYVQPIPAKESEHIFYGCPSTDCTILYREGYVLCHDNDKKVADWVSYHLADKYLVKNAERTDDFRADNDLAEGERSELEDYKGSGYDRGHLAPAGDMTRSKKIMSESFLLSNMAPQVGVGFNRGIWKVLEKNVRDWAEEREDIYVITGPIYAESEYDTIGPNEVAVPTHFYKTAISGSPEENNLDAIAFILPNEKNSSSLLPEFITTIDDVEEKTNLDFLHELDDTVEDELEAEKTEMW